MKTETNKYVIILWILTAAYIFAFCLSAVLRYAAFDYKDMDLAVYAQIIWQIPRGEMVSSVLGVNFLGHHVHLLAFPIALIYLIAPHPLTLLFLQTLALGLGAIPLYFIARRILEDRWALVIAFCYLVYPGLGLTNAYEFHFTPFATLSLLCACYYFLEQKYRRFLITMGITLLIQENLALVTIAFGIYALFLKREKKWSWPLLFAGGVYFIFCVKVILASLNPDKIQFISIYKNFGDSYGEILRTFLTRPGYTIGYMFAPQRIDWLIQLFLPLIFVPLLAPIHLLPAAPLFLQHLLSNRPQEINLYFHYTAELIPFIFLSFIFGIKKLTTFESVKNYQLFFRIIILSWVLLYSVREGLFEQLFNFSRVKKEYTDEIKNDLINTIPSEASVITTFEFMSRLSHRQGLYSFHHFYWGFYTLSNKPYDPPQSVDFALIDLNDGLTFGSFYGRLNYLKINSMLKRYNLVPIIAKDNTVVFKKNAEKGIDLYLVSKQNERRDIPQDPLWAEGGAELMSVDVRPVQNILDMNLYWHTASVIQQDINVYVDFIDENNVVVKQLLIPTCYRIYPTQAWNEGEWILDQKHLVIPPDLQGKDFSLRLGFVDQNKERILRKNVTVQIQP